MRWPSSRLTAAERGGHNRYNFTVFGDIDCKDRIEARKILKEIMKTLNEAYKYNNDIRFDYFDLSNGWWIEEEEDSQQH